MKKLVFYILASIMLLSCSDSTQRQIIYKSAVCFNSQTELDEFLEFNNFADQHVKLTVKGENCIEVVTKDQQTIDQLRLTVAAENQKVEVEVTQYFSKSENNDEESLFELPTVSFPSIFDVFDRLIGSLATPK